MLLLAFVGFCECECLLLMALVCLNLFDFSVIYLQNFTFAVLSIFGVQCLVYTYVFSIFAAQPSFSLHLAVDVFFLIGFVFTNGDVPCVCCRLVIVGWLLVTLTFILCGVFLVLHK